MGLKESSWQHVSDKWASIVTVRVLSMATLPNPGRGHLAGNGLFVHQALVVGLGPDGGSGGPMPFQGSPAGLCAL